MSAAALRQQRYREREREGKIMVTIQVDAAEIIELLVESNLLDPRRDYFPRSDIAAGIERFLILARDA